MTQNLGGRTKICKTRVSVDNLMKLLEGVVLLIKTVLMCSGPGEHLITQPLPTAQCGGGIIVTSLTPMSITWEG